jgi:hypothetical protein
MLTWAAPSNAVSESAFATIKKELVYRCEFSDREARKLAIFEYMEVFYNRDRDHSSLCYLKPKEFEQGGHLMEPSGWLHGEDQAA